MDHNFVPELIEGTITKKIIRHFGVRCAEEQFTCTLAPRLLQSGRRKGTVLSEPQQVAVGDRVLVKNTGNGSGVIVNVLKRRNLFSRMSTAPHAGAYAGEQVIAANLDQVVPVFAAAQPAPHWRLLDRYLTAAEAQEIPAVISITKMDLVAENDEDHIHAVVKNYRRIGYPVVMVSAYTGQGLDELKILLQGRFSAFLGKSGVGKTSLLNALQPGLGQTVRAVNQATGKGRHTTTHHEMFALDCGGSILDCPGNREFGLWGVEPHDLALLFPEMQPHVGRCKFGLDCLHDEEPGCAIRKAVMAGEIDPLRYQSYLYLLEDL